MRGQVFVQCYAYKMSHLIFPPDGDLEWYYYIDTNNI